MEENKDILNNGLKSLSEDDVKDARVENARTRPNSTGLYGSASLKQEDVKKIFDAYPEKLREKLNEVIAFANALLGVLGTGIDGETITESLNFLADRVGNDDLTEDPRFSLNTLASAILKLSEDLKAEEENGEKRDERISRFESERGVTKVDYDDKNEVITFTFADGNVVEIDLPLESLVEDARFEEDKLFLVLENGTEVEVSTEKIAEAIAKNEKSIIPADTQHCYREADGIHLKDNSGKSVLIPLKELSGTATDAEIYGLVKVETGGEGGLALNGGFITTNPANAAELESKDEQWKPVTPDNFAVGLKANLKAGNGVNLDYDAEAKEVTVSVAGGTVVKVNGEAVSEFDADTKVDIKPSPYAGVNSVYMTKPDGTQGLIQIGRAIGQIPVRTTDGHIIVSTTAPTDKRCAAPYKYVDDKVGEIETALDAIIEIQNSLLGGASE